MKKDILNKMQNKVMHTILWIVSLVHGTVVGIFSIEIIQSYFSGDTGLTLTIVMLCAVGILSLPLIKIYIDSKDI